MKDIALIIPTYNRRKYVHEIVNYYLSCNINAKIYVVDSSEVYDQKMKSFSEVEYLHYPGIPMTKKLHLCLTQLNEEFCHICADDDYYSVSFLKLALKMMKKGRHSCVYGMNYGYRVQQNEITIIPIYSHSLRSRSDYSSIADRVANHFSEYNPLIYVLTKTRYLRDAYEILSQQKITNYCLQEFIVSFINLINGPACYLKRPHCFRETPENRHNDLSKDPLRMNIPSLVLNQDKEYLRSIAILADYISRHDPKVSIEESCQIIESGYNSYLNIFLPRYGKLNISLGWMNSVIYRIFSSLKMRNLLNRKSRISSLHTFGHLQVIAKTFWHYRSPFNPVFWNVYRELSTVQNSIRRRERLS